MVEKLTAGLGNLTTAKQAFYIKSAKQKLHVLKQLQVKDIDSKRAVQSCFFQAYLHKIFRKMHAKKIVQPS